MKKKTDKAKKTEEELFREQQGDLLKFAREPRKEEERKERRHKIISSIKYLLSYFVSILWMAIAVRGSLEKSEDWMLASIIGSIWLLIAIVSSK